MNRSIKEIEKSIKKTYKKEVWNKFIKGIKEFENDPIWHARQLKGNELEIGKKRLKI